MLKAFIASLVILVVCLALLCVRIFFGRRFVNTHVDGNKALRRRGIYCARTQDAIEQRKRQRGVSERSQKSSTQEETN